jgi:uncharacterized protein YqeY
MSLADQITADMKTAMKAQDAARLSTLRMIMAALLNLAKSGQGKEISDDDVLKTLNTLLKQRRDAMEQFAQAGRAELAAKERAEAAIIEGYLPQAATPEEIEQAVLSALAETGATSPKQMGAVMKATLAHLAGRTADGRAVSAAVKAKLTGI